jgi:cytochrome P450
MNATLVGPPPANNLLAQFRLLNHLQRDLLGVIDGWHQHYGDTFRLQFGGLRQYFIRHPDDVQAVLVTQAGKFIKDDDYRNPKTGMARFLGNGLVTSNGEFWRRQRKLAAPAFHAKRIEAYAATMVTHTEQMLAGWRDGARLDVAQETLRLTMLIVAKALFSADVAADVQRVARAVEMLQELMGQRSLIPPWVPTPRELRARQALSDLDEVVYRLIREWRAVGEDKGDLLSMLLLARDDEGLGMTDLQARDEVVTLLAAGHETTANTLNWTFKLLAHHPASEAKLHAELDSVLAGRAPALADLPRLPYTEMVIKESMRLYPPAWAISREATEDVQLREAVIAKGNVVGITIYSVHHDARWFPEPEKFDPERFSPEREPQIPRYAYLPFGGGPRVCIGNSFALLEARLLLATIARRYTLSLAPGQIVQPLARVTLSPRGGLPMTAHERQPIKLEEASHALAY